MNYNILVLSQYAVGSREDRFVVVTRGAQWRWRGGGSSVLGGGAR